MVITMAHMASRSVRIALVAWLAAAMSGWADHAPGAFVRRSGTHFLLDRQRVYYLGANCYYLAYFAQDTNVAVGAQTWRDMADEVLTRSRSLGVRVIRIWAFNEDDRGEFAAPHGDWRLQTAPGAYREAALRGLDYVLDKANQLDLFVVPVLVNNWDDYGGMRWYVTNSPTATGTHDAFYTDGYCRQWFRNHVSTLVSRTNSINGRVYGRDPTIFGWQLANEPRCAPGAALTNWVYQTAAFIKSIDTNHMVSTGEEGWYPEWLGNAACSNVDYTVIHCWPDWWWSGGGGTLYSNAMDWVADHVQDSALVGKPIVLSEYGRRRPLSGPPLDGLYGRNQFYQGWFDLIYNSAAADGPAAGMHFWMMEADNAGHNDDVGSVFSWDTSTMRLLSGEAAAFNTLIAPEIDAFTALPGGMRLRWSGVVGGPAYRVETSDDLSQWDGLDVGRTNEWTDTTASTLRRFYRVVPVY